MGAYATAFATISTPEGASLRRALLRAFTLANEGRLMLGTETALADGKKFRLAA